MQRSPQKRNVSFDHLSKCARQYADAISDPFDCDEGACLPIQTLAESQKARVFVRTSFVTGTNAMGFVLVNPFAFGFSNQASVYVTGATYAGLDFNTSGTGIVGTSSNAPFATGGSVKMRLVALGIRVKNRSQVLNREGIVTGLCEPSHTSLSGLTVNNVGAYDQAWREVVDAGDAHFSVKWDGVASSDEEAFSDTGFYQASSGGAYAGTATHPCIGIAAEVTSAANPQVFDVLIVGHYEYTGTTARGKTITWADPQGAAIVNTAARRAALHTTARSQDSGIWWDSFRSTVAEGVRMVMPLIPPALRAASAYAAGGAPAAAASLMSSTVGRSLSKNKPLLLKDKKKKKK